MQTKISYIFAAMILASCGGGTTNTDTGGGLIDSGGGGTNPTDGNGTDNGTDNGNENGNSSGANSGGGTAQTESIKFGDLKITQSGTQDYMYFDGQKIALDVERLDGDAIVYQEKQIGDRRYNAQAFKGDDVKGWVGSWHAFKDVNVTADHFVQGNRTLPQYVPNTKHSYEGVFILLHPHVQDIGSLNFDMVWTADFENDKFTGRDYPHQANIFFDGNINGSQIAGHVDHSFGASSFEGHFFGPYGSEIAGSTENNNVQGIFYGEKNDAFLSDN